MAYDIFDLQGTPEQNELILSALRRTNFPWEKLEAKLLATQGKRKIPVEWADLTSYGASASVEKAEEPDDTHDDHEHEEKEQVGHFHVNEGGDVAHGIAFREQTLGLAWYSGKISMDISLESRPALAGEVFLSEGAHMVDFFMMTDNQRTDIFNAFHGTTVAPAAHGHGWFDAGSYNTWVGEAFMGGFVKAFSDLPVTIPFVHPPTAYTNERIREILNPAPADPTPVEPAPVEPKAEEPTPDATPEPTPEPAPEEPTTTEPTPTPTPKEDKKPKKDKDSPEPLKSSKFTRFFHGDHEGYNGSIKYNTREEALEAGKVPCLKCKA